MFNLELRFDEFRVEGSSLTPDECDNDYLEVGGEIGASGDIQIPATRYCGTFTGIRLIDMGKSFKRFVFHTDKENSEVGYSIHVQQISCQFPEVSTPSERGTPESTSPEEPVFPQYSSSSEMPIFHRSSFFRSPEGP